MGAEVLLFGATYPLALLGPRLAARGLPYLSAAHGFEYWLSIAPGTHALLRHATSRATRVPVLCSAFIARTVRTAVPRSVPVSVLYPGADVTRFRPDLATDDIRETLGVGDASACRLREPAGRPQGPGHADPRDAGHPPPCSRCRARDRGRRPRRGSRCASMAAELPAGAVAFSGQVAEDDLPRYYAAGDVFAMPCRTRLGGLEVEGWGNVFIEAAACGKPVVVGDSGGARESLVDGETGLLVDGTTGRHGRRCGRRACWRTPSGPGRWGPRGGSASCAHTPGRRSPSVSPPGWVRPRTVHRPGKSGASLPGAEVGGTLPRVSHVERRCPNCNALVSEDADWCGQCFADLRRSPPPPPAPPVAAEEPARRLARSRDRRPSSTGRSVLAVQRLRRAQPHRAGGRAKPVGRRSPRSCGA